MTISRPVPPDLKSAWRALVLAPLLVLLALLAAPASAQQNPFEGGWVLDPAASTLNFQSTKNLTKVESSGFAAFSGQIAPDGTATVVIELESVDTKIDLRNVRMRFLFFETFQFPKATITARLDPAMLSDLETVRRKRITLPVMLDLHGVQQELTGDLAVTLLSDDIVAVSTATPVTVATAQFNLDGGVQKLEEAAGVKIVPSAGVTFDFLFRRGAAGSVPAAPAAPAPAAEPAAPQPQIVSAALETQGNFDTEACVGRFEILSRTDNITFRSGSARLDDSSAPLLDSIVDIVNRCPGLAIEVGGHTDSDGGANTNLRLSERRAAAVVDYLTGKGADAARISARGYGEAQPAFPNDSRENKRRNRRIEFKVSDG